ncbi:MAG: hypothetical protein RIQ53_1414 [Pseudomonadota bacterium]|jgi:signal transduction histidine kinase/DNA-binding response OmpR family regulator
MGREPILPCHPSPTGLTSCMSVLTPASLAYPRDRWVQGGVLATLGLLLVVDVMTPLGVAVWALYVAPLVATLWQRRIGFVWLTVLLSALLIALGYLWGPVRAAAMAELAQLNRLLGVLLFIGLGVVVTQVLRQRDVLARELWLQETEARLAPMAADNPGALQLLERVLQTLALRLDALAAASYVGQADGWALAASHGAERAQLAPHVHAGDGLLGQCAEDGRMRLISPAPEGHLSLRSALGRSRSPHLLLLPLREGGHTIGLLELAIVRPQLHRPTVERLAARLDALLGPALGAARVREERQRLLEETQRQTEELRCQQEALRRSNDELAAQGDALRLSQAELEQQQAELERVHGELAAHAARLEQRQIELMAQRTALREQARALATASRYKSEFLANMSHELRTPLNSSLILSRLLIDDRHGRLGDEERRWAQAIHEANNDLLLLINDILDLSRIEAGHADLQAEAVSLAPLLERLRGQFQPQAEQRGLRLLIDVEDEAPAAVVSDGLRLQQVLRNLLANALKFTARGQVRLRVAAGPAGGVCFDVIDTGMGIAPEQQQLIFEAFRQADGSTSREFGGTGLGLTISRELVQRLGGQLTLVSVPGHGSTFSVRLPAVMPEPAVAAAAPSPHPPQPTAPASAMPVAPGPARAMALPRPSHDDPATDLDADLSGPWSPHRPAAPDGADASAGTDIGWPGPGRDASRQGAQPLRGGPQGAPAVLVVEDDAAFALGLAALIEDEGLGWTLCGTGESALREVAQAAPVGVLLDLGLPDISGLSVLERLKRDLRTRHLPVHILSAAPRQPQAGAMGAVGHLVKPAGREALVQALREMRARAAPAPRQVLVVEDDPGLRRTIELLLEAPGVEVRSVARVDQALQAVRLRVPDCIVTDLNLPDASGFELLERLAAQARAEDVQAVPPPVIVYTGRALSRDDEARLRRHSHSIIVKGARSPERLLDEVTLFLHRDESQLPDAQRQLLQQARRRDAVLDGRRVLLVEDDVRNIFAMTSVLEPLGVVLDVARDGRQALQRLAVDPLPDLVLMDLMMPEMDGLSAMRAIRQRPGMERLPLIALTAKAMADDRAQALEAGANDYLSKPVDVERLISLCRVWLSN